MATTEQFSLRWNNFHSNIASGFHDLLEASDLVDVTLAVEGQFLYAHKLILSICSPYFKEMFKQNPCKHPIIILKDVSHKNLKDILEFMYVGEVNVLRENLSLFLRTAEMLRVKGLSCDDTESDSSKSSSLRSVNNNTYEDSIIEEDYIEETQTLPTSSRRSKHVHNSNAKKIRSAVEELSNNNQDMTKEDEVVVEEPVIKIEYPQGTSQNDQEWEDGSMESRANTSSNWTSNNVSEVGLQEQGETCAMRGGQFKCKTCRRVFTRRDHLKTHEKNIHGEAAGPFACVMCAQFYKNTESLRKHMAKFHLKHTALNHQQRI